MVDYSSKLKSITIPQNDLTVLISIVSKIDKCYTFRWGLKITYLLKSFVLKTT